MNAARALGGSRGISSSPVSQEQHGGRPACTSTKFDPVLIRGRVKETVRDEIRMTFPATSNWGTAKLAHAHLGVDPHTILRHIALEVEKPDWALVEMCRELRKARGGIR